MDPAHHQATIQARGNTPEGDINLPVSHAVRDNHSGSRKWSVRTNLSGCICNPPDKDLGMVMDIGTAVVIFVIVVAWTWLAR